MATTQKRTAAGIEMAFSDGHATHETSKREPTSFLDLAPELRNRIYEEALSFSSPDDRIDISTRIYHALPHELWIASKGRVGSTRCTAIALLRSCKQVGAEALPIFWSINYFCGSGYTYKQPILEQPSAGLAGLGLSRGMVVRDLRLRTDHTRGKYGSYFITVTNVTNNGEPVMKVVVEGVGRCYDFYSYSAKTMSFANWVDGAGQVAADLRKLTGVKVTLEVASDLA
ncbi:hypothetical protein LTR85_000177 [Meristemomyces frigidus]|nr:hypothetical protein LTR85_000177 [Meristemomyces frigidus]